jgi:hypothetical protein
MIDKAEKVSSNSLQINCHVCNKPVESMRTYWDRLLDEYVIICHCHKETDRVSIKCDELDNAVYTVITVFNGGQFKTKITDSCVPVTLGNVAVNNPVKPSFETPVSVIASLVSTAI